MMRDGSTPISSATPASTGRTMVQVATLLVISVRKVITKQTAPTNTHSGCPRTASPKAPPTHFGQPRLLERQRQRQPGAEQQ